MARLITLLERDRLVKAYSLNDLPEQEYEILQNIWFKVWGHTYVFILARGADDEYYRIVECAPKFLQALRIACAANVIPLTFFPSDFVEREREE